MRWQQSGRRDRLSFRVGLRSEISGRLRDLQASVEERERVRVPGRRRRRPDAFASGRPEPVGLRAGGLEVRRRRDKAVMHRVEGRHGCRHADLHLARKDVCFVRGKPVRRFRRQARRRLLVELVDVDVDDGEKKKNEKAGSKRYRYRETERVEGKRGV